MSHHQAFKSSSLVVGVLALMLASSDSPSYGLDGLPQTPCPCAADGNCRPNRPTWGVYKTRWRTWPGESVGKTPTPADGATGGQPSQQPLEPYQLPLPEQEDLRGPAKTPKADQGEPADGPVQPLPGPVDLPAFDPQGSNSEFPPMEDAPPILPPSLRQVSQSFNIPRTSIRQIAHPANMQPLSMLQRPTATQLIALPPIDQPKWQQPAIGLINPASAILVEPAASSLQRAIYYEASDLEASAE